MGGALSFWRFKDFFTNPIITPWDFPVSQPNSHANHVSLGDQFFYYSASNTFNSELISKYVTQKVNTLNNINNQIDFFSPFMIYHKPEY